MTIRNAVELFPTLQNLTRADKLKVMQFLNYRLALRLREPERVLFLAVPVSTYRSLFSRDFAQSSVQEYQVKLIVYDPKIEVIVQWQS
ncbi:element excision factor XisH family protein [Nostoc sp. JL33]|uniref:element excision factor XisH family protein n=1 Tax=Nostoc sp. JL33 TaxID=2815396 RepID=UPI0025D526E4|nr:element excision factor XisH family protein [Nostoc sp. JL33]MBN3871395.1 hypothetical protein [Nostoc sp. JL33]